MPRRRLEYNFLHELGKKTEQVLENRKNKICFALVFRYCVARFQNSYEVVFQVCDGLSSVHPCAALEVQVQAAEIKVHSADDAHFVVRNDCLGVDHTLSILIYFDTGFDKLSII